MLLQLRMASQAADRLFEDTTNISRAQFHALAAVEKATRTRKNGVPQAMLVESTGVDRSTLSSVMERLEQRGLISRKRSKEDARAYNVKLTLDGRLEWQRLDKLSRAVDAQLQRYVTLPEVVLSSLEKIATMEGVIKSEAA